MKLNVWIVCALAPLTALLALAQDTSTTLETAPAAPTKKAPGIKKKVDLDPPVPAVVRKPNVNVRGRSSFTGETIGHLQKGQAVTVLEQITLSHTTKDEPSEWAKISLPSDIPVWVDADLVNAKDDDIKARRVNLRGGPGENYSVLGRLERGTAIKEIKREKGWIEIEAPTNAYAYVAAEFLDMQPTPPPAPVVVTPPAPVPTPTPTPEPEVVNVPPSAAPPAVAATETAPVSAPPPSRGDVDKELQAVRQAESNTPPVVLAAPNPTPPPASTEAETPRVVTREGFVRRSYNIQAPTDFELHEVESGKLIDFLQPKKGQNFKIFVGTRVTVTGPEGVNVRWLRVPVLEVQSVDLIP